MRLTIAMTRRSCAAYSLRRRRNLTNRPGVAGRPRPMGRARSRWPFRDVDLSPPRGEAALDGVELLQRDDPGIGGGPLAESAFDSGHDLDRHRAECVVTVMAMGAAAEIDLGDRLRPMRAGRVEKGRDLDSVTHRHEHPRERRPTDRPLPESGGWMMCASSGALRASRGRATNSVTRPPVSASRPVASRSGRW